MNRTNKNKTNVSNVIIKLKDKYAGRLKVENKKLLMSKVGVQTVRAINEKGILPRIDNWYNIETTNDMKTILNDPDIEAAFIDNEAVTEDVFEFGVIYSETNYQSNLRDQINWGDAITTYDVGNYSPLLLGVGASAYPFDVEYKDRMILFDPPIHNPIQWINGTADEIWGECWWRNPCIDNGPCTSATQCQYNGWTLCDSNNPITESWGVNNLFQCSNWDWSAPYTAYHETAVLSIMGANGDIHGVCPHCKLGMVTDTLYDDYLVPPTTPFSDMQEKDPLHISRTYAFQRAVENAITYGAVAINCSWGSTIDNADQFNWSEVDARREFWQGLVDDAWDNNVLIIASAGNNEGMADNDIKCNPNPLITLNDGSVMYASDCANLTTQADCTSVSFMPSSNLFYGPCTWSGSYGCLASSNFTGQRFPTCLQKVIQVQGSDGQSNFGTEGVLTDELGIYAVSAPFKNHMFGVPRNDDGLNMTSGDGYDRKGEIFHHPYTQMTMGGANIGLRWTGDNNGGYQLNSDSNIPQTFINNGLAQSAIDEYMWFIDDLGYFQFTPNPQAVSKWNHVGSGTSYGAPMVAGLVGLLRAHNPDLTSDQTVEIILNGRHTLTTPQCQGAITYSNNAPFPPNVPSEPNCTNTTIPEIDVKLALDYLYLHYPPLTVPDYDIPYSWNYDWGSFGEPDDESCTGTTTCEEQPPEVCQYIFEINDECQLSGGTVTDIDGNVYDAILIGNQLWMSENLKVTHYNNGDVIPNITNNGDWGSYDEGQYGVYDNDPSLAELYGNLYNWAVVDDERGICPEGWHVPSDEEFKTLEMYLGMSQSEADGMDWRGTNEGSKLAGNANLWNNGNLEINPEFGTSGFTSIPSGYRSSSNSSNGFYNNVGNYTYFWSSTEYSSTTALHRSLFYNTTTVKRWDYGKKNGFPVRCLEDDITTIDDLVCTGSDELDCAYYESILSYCLEGCDGGFSDIDPGCTSNLSYLCPQGHCAISREFCYFGGEWEQTSETDLDNWVSSDAILYCEELAYPENGIGYNTDFDTIEQIPFLNGDSWVPSIPREAVEGFFMPSAIDVDGNEYESISFQSGSLSYAMLTTNLKTTKYNNGDDITTGLNNNDWISTASGSYSYYNDDPSNLETYGNLYNWFAAVDERGICPEGWHVPSDEEYKALEMYLGMPQSAADGLGPRGTNEGSKLAGNANLWNNGNLENNAEFGTSGFAGVPSGYRRSSNGNYNDIGRFGYFWSSTEYSSTTAWDRLLLYHYTTVNRHHINKRYGFSVRCTTDNPIQPQTIPPGQGTGQGLYTNSYGDQFQIPTDGLTHYKVSDLQLIEFFIVNCEGSSYYHQSINPFNFISDQSHWSIQYETNFNHTGETHVFKSLSVFRPEDWVDENGERVISPFGCKCISTNDIADFFHVNMNMIDPECNDFATCQYQMLTTDGHLPAGTNLSTIDLDYLGIYGTLDELVHAMQLQTHHENVPSWFDYSVTNTTIADTLGVFRLSHNNITSNWFTNEGCYSTGDYGHFPMYCNTWQRIFSENIFPEVYHVSLRNNHLYGWIDRTMLDWSEYNNNPPAHLTDQFPDYRSFLAYNTNLQTVNLKHNHLGWGDNMLYEHLPSSLLCQNIISNLGLENNNFCPPYPECYDSSVFSNQDLPFHFHTNGNYESQGYTHGIRHSNCHLTETVICCVDHDFTGSCDIDSPIIEISDSPTGIGPVLPCSENHTYANYSANASNQCILWLNNYFQSNYIGMGASPDYINDYMSCNLFAYEENYSNTRWINCPGGNCSTDILGCMDWAAENYNPEATVNYECIYTAGCPDPIAENYVEGNDGCDSGWGVIFSDTSCCEYIIGCMDVLSSSFDPEATMSCGDEDSDGYPDCCESIEGCTDPLSSNYNSDAVIDDGSCVGYAEELVGCPDPFADNYLGSAISCTGTWNITPPYIDFDCCTYPHDWDGNWFACIDRAAINCDPQCIQCNQNGNVECLSCPQIAILPDGWNDTDGDGAPDTICEMCEYGELGCTNWSVPHTGDAALSALNYSPIAQIFDGTCDYGNLEQNVCEPFILYLVVDMTGSMGVNGVRLANELLQHYETFEDSGGYPCGFGLIATDGIGAIPYCETAMLSLADALYLTDVPDYFEFELRCNELGNIAQESLNSSENEDSRSRRSLIPFMYRAYEHLMNDEYYTPHQGCLASESPQKIMYVVTDDDGVVINCHGIPGHQGEWLPWTSNAGPYDVGYGYFCAGWTSQFEDFSEYFGPFPCYEHDIQIFRQQLIENNVKVFMDLQTPESSMNNYPCYLNYSYVNDPFDYHSMVFHFGPHPNFIYNAVPYSVPTDCNCTPCPGHGICWWDGYGNYDHTEKCCFYNCVNGSDGCCTQWEYAGCASDDCTGQLQDWLDNFLIDIDGDGIPDGFDYDGDGEIDDTWDDLGWIWPDWPDDFGGQGYGCDDPAAANCDCWCEECAGQTNYLISAAIGSCVPSAEDSTEGVIELCANLVFDDEGDELLYPIYGCESDSQCSWIPLVCGGNASSCINDNSCKYFGCVDNSIDVISCEDSDNNYYDLPGQECFHPDNDGCNPSDDAWITNEHYCCVYTEEIFGCTDTGACNYDPDATAFQDDSCVYAADLYGQYCDCDGVEIYYSYDSPVFGVSNINYQACDCNTLPLVCCVDVSGNDTCDHYNDLVTSCEDECPEGYKILDDLNDNIPPSQDIDIFGCMDDTAYNYNPNATEENNTCIFLGCNPDHDFCIDVEEIKPLPFEQDCCTVGDEGTCIYAAHGCWWSELLNHCYIEGEHHTPGEPIPIDHDTMCGTPSVDLADQYGYVQFTYSYPEQLDVSGVQFIVYSPFYENTELGYCAGLQNITPLPNNLPDCFNAGGTWDAGGFEFINWDNTTVSNTLGIYDYDTALQGNWTLIASYHNVMIFNNTNTSDPYISTTNVNRAPLMKIKYNIHTANPDYILSYLDLCIELDNMYISDSSFDSLNASSSKCANVILQPGSGDVDLDLVVSVADIILLIAMIMDEFTLDSYTEDQLYVMNILGNINFDGEINVADILLVISIILYGPSFVLSPEDELKMQQIQKVVQRHQKIKTKEPIIPGKPFRPSKRKIINILNKFNLNAKKMSKKSLQPPRVK